MVWTVLKLAQTTQNVWNFIVVKVDTPEKWQTLAITVSGRFQTLIWRPGDTVLQNLESPRLSRKDDSPAAHVFCWLFFQLVKCQVAGKTSEIFCRIEMVCYKFANKLLFSFANLLFLQVLLVAFEQIECLCFLQYFFCQQILLMVSIWEV